MVVIRKAVFNQPTAQQCPSSDGHITNNGDFSAHGVIDVDDTGGVQRVNQMNLVFG